MALIHETETEAGRCNDCGRVVNLGENFGTMSVVGGEVPICEECCERRDEWADSRHHAKALGLPVNLIRRWNKDIRR